MVKVEYSSEYDNYLAIFDDYANKVFNTVNTDSNLAEAMKYSFFAGGKRVRPVLMIAATERLNGKIEKVLPYAFALECIHTYSLIHDDLPALDNDVLRRGKPTCHTAFDEATAILAGDGLLNFAFEHLLNHIVDNKDIAAAKTVAEYSGYDGMLGGQKADIENEHNPDCDVDTINYIYDKKTGKFLTLPFLIPSILFAPEKTGIAKECGFLLGRIFQYCDDLLDVLSTSEREGKSIGKDEKSGKSTVVKILGDEEVKRRIADMKKYLYARCEEFIDVTFLKSFVDKFSGFIEI